MYSSHSSTQAQHFSSQPPQPTCERNDVGDLGDSSLLYNQAKQDCGHTATQQKPQHALLQSQQGCSNCCTALLANTCCHVMCPTSTFRSCCSAEAVSESLPFQSQSPAPILSPTRPAAACASVCAAWAVAPWRSAISGLRHPAQPTFSLRTATLRSKQVPNGCTEPKQSSCTNACTVC